MTAIREDKSDKPDWELVFSSFKRSLEELAFARSYSAKRHTIPEEGIDGRTNWKESAGSPKHDEWIRTCLSAAMRHIVERTNGETLELDQEGIHNLAFAVQNLLMVMEYDFHEHTGQDETKR